MRLHIGSAFGIPVYLHWTMLLVPLLFLSNSQDHSGLMVTACVVPLVFGCVILHEFGHALAARQFGVPTRDITLYPIGGVARLEKMPEKPLQEFVIAIAGPAVNVAIAALLAITLGVMLLADVEVSFAGSVLFGLLLTNVVLVVFNMLPAFPMDGGRVLRSALSACLGFYQGTLIAVWVGRAVGLLIAIVGVGLLGNYMLLLIVLFVFFAGQQELMAARYREAVRLRRQEVDDSIPEVIPVRSAYRPFPPAPEPAMQPPLMLQPRISVFTWDNQTGTWRAEPHSST